MKNLYDLKELEEVLIKKVQSFTGISKINANRRLLYAAIVNKTNILLEIHIFESFLRQ